MKVEGTYEIMMMPTITPMSALPELALVNMDLVIVVQFTNFKTIVDFPLHLQNMKSPWSSR